MEFHSLVFMSVGLCVTIGLIILKWNEIMYFRKRRVLPPGTMGWPIFGETNLFMKQGPHFMKKQRERYGNLFKTHILGTPAVISMDPELNRYIFMNESKGLVPGYPQSTLDILGKCNIAAVHGSTHRYMRGSMLSLIGTANIKENLFMRIDKYMRVFLQNWNDKIIDIQAKTKEMSFFISFVKVAEAESSSFFEAFKREFDKMYIGTLSLPINIPGTNYHQGLQGRKNVDKMLRQMIEKRRASPMENHNDLINLLLGNGDVKYGLSDEEIIDQVVTILYSGYETESTTSMMALKYLHDHPKALQQIKDEHFRIRENKKPEEPLDWNDYASMPFTRAVVLETLRLAKIVNGVLRKTVKEIELQGYVIPKGWRIYVYTGEINHDPSLYPDPLLFDPWRWLEKSVESHKYMFMFGAGTRHCPGKELGIVTISTFLHYFITNYRWEEVGGEKLLKFPRVKAPNGLHIRVSKY